MSLGPEVRELNADDRLRLGDVFDRFRTEFAVWSNDYPNLWELLAFVQYEGISLPIVHEAEPFITGEKCVALYGAKWCMLKVGEAWHFAIDHADFAKPLDVTQFDRKLLERTLSRKWKRILLQKDAPN